MARGKNKKLIAAVGSLAAIALAAAFAFGLPASGIEAAEQPAAPQTIPVEVATVVRREVTTWDEFSGRLEAVERVELRSRVAGAVQSVHFVEGSLVKRGDLLIRIGRWPAMFLILTLALAVIYRYGPSRETARWRWVTWGSAIAALLWIAVSGAFSWYAANFGKFNETYGSLGAIIGFMTWLWISAIVVLLGAEIDAEMEHQIARDTTTGGEKPMGQRGARVADTLGSSPH